jgi:subtilase family serine protease
LRHGTRYLGLAGTAALVGASLFAAGAPAVAVVSDIQPGALSVLASTTQPPTQSQCVAAFTVPCYVPTQLQTAYNVQPLFNRGITGRGETIVLVDAFGSPSIKSDLSTFDAQFGIPDPPHIRVIQPDGPVNFDPTSGVDQNWAGETTLDVEYSHAMAPGANILLVETPVAETEGVTGFPQIVKAEEYALARYKVGVISQSFSATEETFKDYAQLAPLRAAYTDAQKRHVTVLAASGDDGAADYKSNATDYYTRRVTSWPDSDPLVTAVGGTRLQPSGKGYKSVAWNDTENLAWNVYANGSTDPVPAASGGGTSEFFARPSYQNGVKAVTGPHRGVPDIAMSAACDGAVNVYSSYQHGAVGWSLTCGTSEATPEFAAVVALADQVAGHPLGLINPGLYHLSAKHAPGVVDVTSGNNTVSFYQGSAAKPVTVKGYPARKGYDLVAGVGTVNAQLFVYELAGK